MQNSTSKETWIQRLKQLPDEELKDLAASMEAVSKQYAPGERQDFLKQLQLVNDEINLRKKQDPGEPGP